MRVLLWFNDFLSFVFCIFLNFCLFVSLNFCILHKLVQCIPERFLWYLLRVLRTMSELGFVPHWCCKDHLTATHHPLDTALLLRHIFHILDVLQNLLLYITSYHKMTLERRKYVKVIIYSLNILFSNERKYLGIISFWLEGCRSWNGSGSRHYHAASLRANSY